VPDLQTGNRPLSTGTIPRAVFTEGSTMRHVIVMTAATSVGLMAIFVVDLLSLLWVSRLGDTKSRLRISGLILFDFY
jgi:hypothetical protein